MTGPRFQGEQPLGVGVPTLEATSCGPVLDAYDAHHDELFAYLIDATRDRSIAEDLVQEAFLRLAREAKAGRMPAQPRPWLYRVATNLVVSRSRRVISARRWFERIGVPERREAVDESPEHRFLRNEAAADLDVVLRGVGEDARAALLLSAEGFTGHEIAAALGRSESATRTLMCRARIRIRHELAATGGAR